jgi:hypothetical protein
MFAVSGLKIIGHGNAGNNLESTCIYIYINFLIVYLKTLSAV